MLSPSPVEISDSMKGGAKRRGVPVKTLKKLLKKAGLKTSGKKAALTRRAKKARLMKGGVGETPVVAPDAEEKAKAINTAITGGDEEIIGARRRRKSRGFKLF
jgi:hypothetical protein